MIKLEDIVAFSRIAEKQSFTAAAKELAISKSAASKHITRLERELGLKLVHRSTHKLFLTEAGKAYYEDSVRIIGAIEQARINVLGVNGEVKGALRILTTPGVAQALVAPAAVDLLAAYPSLSIDVMVTQIDNISIKQEADVIVSSRDFYRGAASHMSLASHELGVVPYVVCAAPQYLEQHGPAKTPQSLSSHNCLVYTLEGTPPENWRFIGARGAYSVKVAGTLRSNHESVVLCAAIQGAGIARLPEYTAHADLATGRLVQLFQGAVQSHRIIKAYYPRSKVIPVKLQAFINCLKTRLEQPVNAAPNRARAARGAD